LSTEQKRSHFSKPKTYINLSPELYYIILHMHTNKAIKMNDRNVKFNVNKSTSLHYNLNV